MIKLIPGFLPFLLWLFQNPAQATRLPDDRGVVAVYLDLTTTGCNIEFSHENLRSCLKNHIDYYLWSKGWTSDFVYLEDGQLSPAELKVRLSTGQFHQLLYLKAEAEFKSRRIRYIKGEKSDSRKSYPGVLKIKLSVDLCDLGSPGDASAAKTVRAKSRDIRVDTPLGEIIGGDEDRPEPPDFVIKRLLSQALDFLPAYERQRHKTETEIPVHLLIDEQIALSDSVGGMTELYAALEYASELLQRQFGFSLKVCGQRYFLTEPVPLSGTGLIFKTLLKSESARSDTMTLAVFKPDSAEQFYLSDKTLQVGLSDLGRQIVLVAELPAPNQMTCEWKPFLNGQLLLHEIGHLLGAVHVSDINSVMNPRTTWVSSGRFDSLNADIIRAGRAAGLRSMRVTEYLRFVAETIKGSRYKLSDYPLTFFSYINLNPGGFQEENYGGEGVGKAIPFAVDGYRHYLLRNHETARTMFYKALVCDSTQGAIHYYLSRVTSGKLAVLHLRKSSEMGFYRAIHEVAARDDI
jgi:hypothetical protein